MKMNESGQNHVGCFKSNAAEERVNSYSSGSPAIARRISDLEQEWELERVCVVLASVCVAASAAARSTSLGRIAVFAIAAPAAAWSSLKLLRKLGLRTRREIDGEIVALKIIRGDFDGIADELHRRACAMNALKLASEADSGSTGIGRRSWQSGAEHPLAASD